MQAASRCERDDTLAAIERPSSNLSSVLCYRVDVSESEAVFIVCRRAKVSQREKVSVSFFHLGFLFFIHRVPVPASSVSLGAPRAGSYNPVFQQYTSRLDETKKKL